MKEVNSKHPDDSKLLLTDAVVRSLKYDPDGPQHQLVTDSDVRGLMVQLNKASKTWVFYGRIDGTRQQVRKAVGRTDDVKRRYAVAKADEWRGQCAQGIDPRIKDAPVDVEQVTLRELFDEYVRDRRLKDTYEMNRRLKAHVPDWLNKPYRNLKKADVLKRFDRVARVSTPGQAKRLFGDIRAVLNYAVDVDEDDSYNNPCRVLKARGRFKKTNGDAEEVQVPRYTDDDYAKLGRELRDWSSKDILKGNQHVAKWFLWFMVFSGCRRGETVQLKWEYVHADHIFLPTDITKTTSFKLPRTPQIDKVLDGLRPMSNESIWLFPGRHIAGSSQRSHMHRTTPLSNARRAGKVQWLKQCDDTPWNPLHRFRHSIAQIGQDELGIDSVKVGMILNHAVPGKVGMTQQVYSNLIDLGKKTVTLTAIDTHIEMLTGAVR